MRANNKNKVTEHQSGDYRLKELLTDVSSTRIEGSFFSVAITTPLAAVIPKYIINKFKNIKNIIPTCNENQRVQAHMHIIHI
jgi:hypothetical protein